MCIKYYSQVNLERKCVSTPYITRYVSGRAFRSLIRSQTVVSRGFGRFQESESDFADPHLDLDLDLDS